jgi:quinoprotein glucose dehydrogenase
MAWVLRLVELQKAEGSPSGRTLYLKNCSTCHREDLEGTPPEFPSLAGFSKKYTQPEIVLFIRNGGGRMPGFPQLPPAAMRAIAQYVATGDDNKVAAGGHSQYPIEQKYVTDGYNRFLDADGYPAIAPPWGTLNAIDLNKGEIAWKIPFGEYPELAAKGMRDTGSENYGGPLVTDGGLLFIGATNHDRKFHVYDKNTGKLLWETLLPAAGNATPATYAIGGRQFVVIAAGGGKSGEPSGGAYVAFALPQSGR